MTPSVWFHAQLELIPGVSNKIAEAITNKYPTLKSLLSIYTSLDKNTSKKIIEEITYEIKNNKKRKIGPVISERIFTFLFE